MALARALIARPPLLLADEPTGNLDGKTGEGVVEMMFGAAEEASATLVLVTHNDELAQRCARTVVMEDGNLRNGTS